MTMKERYNKFFNSITPEKSDEELLETVLRKAERKNMNKKTSFKKAIIIPVAAVLGLSVTAVTAGAIYNGIQYLQRSGIAENQDVAEKIQSFIYEDSNEHVKMTVEEYLSDGLVAYMTVHYEALTEGGKVWLNTHKQIPHEDLCLKPKFIDQNHSVSHSYGNFEIEEYRTETDRYFRLESTASNRSYGGEQLTFHYVLGSTQKSIDLDTECNVEIYRYELKADENPTDLFTPKYLEISDLTYSVLGVNHKVYAESKGDFGWAQWSLLPENFDTWDYLSPTLIMEDGSALELTPTSAFGALNPVEENYNTDLSICSGSYEFYDEEAQAWGYKSVEAENVAAIELCGTVYELIPME